MSNFKEDFRQKTELFIEEIHTVLNQAEEAAAKITFAQGEEHRINLLMYDLKKSEQKVIDNQLELKAERDFLIQESKRIRGIELSIKSIEREKELLEQKRQEVQELINLRDKELANIELRIKLFNDLEKQSEEIKKDRSMLSKEHQTLVLRREAVGMDEKRNIAESERLQRLAERMV